MAIGVFSRKEEAITHPIVVWPEDLRFLHSFLSEEFTTVTYRAQLEDGTTIEFASLEEVLEYENPDFKRIQNLGIEAVKHSDDGFVSTEDKVNIVLGRPKLPSESTGNLRYSIGSVSTLNRLEREIRARVRQMRPWYHWLYQVNFATAFVTLFFLAFFTLYLGLGAYGLYRRLRGITMPTSPNPPTEAESTALLLTLIALFALTGWLLDKVRNYLFPKTAFCIGRGERWYGRRMYVSYVIFVLIILAIVTNVIANAFSR
jgi:hypothetical protein